MSIARLSFALFFTSFLALAGGLVAGCDAGSRPPVRDGSPGTDAGPSAMCTAGMPGFICVGNSSVQCLDDGTQGAMTDCGATGQVCVGGSCAACRPNAFQCAGNDVQRCNADGSGFTTIATCDPASGTSCNSTTGTCSSPCADAAATNSYIGCEYWPTPTANLVDGAFAFAVVVANPQSSPAEVTVTRAGAMVASATVQPGQTATIELPWIDEYKTPLETPAMARPLPRSALVRGGAYRLVSNLPVTAYQFSPLQFENAGEFSFTNDASLLLPTHVMTGNYIAVSERTRATMCPGQPGFPPIIPDTPPAYISVPGFVTVVGVSETPVSVEVTFAGSVSASTDGAVQAGAAGSTQTFMLNQGDVLQLSSGDVGESCTPGGTTAGQCGGGLADMTHCQVNDSFDLTGSSIRATGRVMVIGGHACAFLPFNRFACDHIEEVVFPLESWGRDFVVSATESLRGEPNIIRVVSGADGNTITFDPPVNPQATLGRGQVLEFEAREDFRVSGSGPILVSQFLVGQNYDGSAGTMGMGDPAMSFAIPTEQFRTEYTFLAPETFTRSFVNVVAPAGVEVMLDGSPVSATWNDVGASGMRAARIEITGGQHQISAGMPIGIVVYGYAQFTSYMYPGGLDFEQINPLI